jgi:hypothetical protein
MNEEIMKRSETARAAFSRIAEKASRATAKDYIAIGAVMQFFEDLPELLTSIESSGEDEMNTAVAAMAEELEEERTTLQAKLQDRESKLKIAAKRIQMLQKENGALESRVSEQKLADNLLSNPEEDFDIEFE